MKNSLQGAGHMTKMAAMHMYGKTKTFKKSSSEPVKLGM